MKVIHLISGGDTGGARTHVYSLLKYLGQIIDVQLVCFRGGDFADGAAALGIPTMVLGKGFLANLRALRRIIRDGEYDLVHCHGALANVTGALLRRHLHVPVISTVHSDYRLDYLGRPFARAVYGTLNTWALHQLDYRVCVSDPIRQRLIDRGFEPNRLFSIYNGLDFSHVVPKTDRAAYFAQFGYTVHEGDVIAGIAARLDPVKDIPTLLRAVALAKKACPQLRLAIAGDGKERKKLEALTKELDLEDSVFFLGWVNDLDSFYGALDINTLSSLSEAFPYALPEGARAHLATVASNVGGVPAIIEHGVTGLLIEPGDVRMLAAYLARFALDADYRHEMGEALYRRGKADFSEEATGLRQLEIYHAVFRMERNRRDGVRDGVLICGAYGFGNTGDDAILQAIIGEMRRIDPHMPVTVLSRRPQDTRSTCGVNACHRFHLFAIRRILRRSQLFISGGGSLMQDVTSRLSLWYYLGTIRMAHRCGCKVQMYGCGIGPIVYERDRQLAARIINDCVDKITLREPDSRETLSDFGVTDPEVILASDPALTLPAAERSRIDRILREHDMDPEGKYIGFVLRKWPGIEEKATVFAAGAVYAYLKYGLTPVGTMAHEFVCAIAGMYGPQMANHIAMRKWSDTYRGALGTFLYDTYGWSIFSLNFSEDFANMFKGLRVDSGDDFQQLDMIVDKYRSLKIDPATKQVVFSNGLDVDSAIRIQNYARNKCIPSFGIGTHFTNDFKNVRPMNIVIKLTDVKITESWPFYCPTCKLSEDKGKYSGNPETVDIFRKLIHLA